MWHESALKLRGARSQNYLAQSDQFNFKYSMVLMCDERLPCLCTGTCSLIITDSVNNNMVLRVCAAISIALTEGQTINRRGVFKSLTCNNENEMIKQTK